MQDATVIAVFGRQAICELEGQLLPCSAVGSLLRRQGPLAAGDVVGVERSGDEGIVRTRATRSSALLRANRRPNQPPLVVAANVDQVIAVLAFREPAFSAGLADRLLVAAAHCGLPAALCVNKWDLADPEDEAALEPYAAIGVPLIRASAEDGRGIRDLALRLEGRHSVAVGHSGVGKSSLLQRLVPGLELRVREVNRVTGRGRHTTTTATLVRLPGGGTLIDTPGIRAFGLHGVTAADLQRHFPELAARAQDCAFEDCEHDSEPDCAVKRALEEGAIPAERYAGYLRILESLRGGRG